MRSGSKSKALEKCEILASSSFSSKRPKFFFVEGQSAVLMMSVYGFIKGHREAVILLGNGKEFGI